MLFQITYLKKMNNNRRSAKAQVGELISYMEDHVLFCRKQIPKLGPKGREKYNYMWRKLARYLNNLGPAIKTITQWKNVIIFLSNKYFALFKILFMY